MSQTEGTVFPHHQQQTRMCLEWIPLWQQTHRKKKTKKKTAAAEIVKPCAEQPKVTI